jgi:hypothetical protein
MQLHLPEDRLWDWQDQKTRPDLVSVFITMACQIFREIVTLPVDGGTYRLQFN